MLKLSRQNFQVIYLYIATLLGSFLGFVTSIVNTNFLTETEYGDVRYVQNMITLLSWVLFLGYFHGGRRLLALSDDESYSRRIRGAMLLLLTVCMLLDSVLVFVVGKMHEDSLAFLFLCSIPICFQPLLVSYISATAQGDNFIGRLALSRVIPPFLYVIIAYYIYSNYVATPSMVLLLQWGIYCIILLAIVFSTKPKFDLLRPAFQALSAENRSYGFHLYCGSLAMVATNYLAGVTLGLFNDNNINVGYYTLALTLTTPLSYLPGIIGVAYFKKFVHESCIPAKVFRSTLLITILSCLCFVVVIRYVVQWCYPVSYAIVADYALWMAVSFSVHGIGDLINTFLSSHGKGYAIRNSSYICGIIKVLGFIFLIWIYDIDGALMTTVLSSCVYCGILYYYYKKNFSF